jgi:hypothetical protein
MNLLKRLGFWIFWLVLVVLFVGIAWYGFEQFPPSPARDAFFGNFLATIIGIVFGIPIALEIERYQQRRQEAGEKAAKDAQQSARKQRILGLIENELVFARNLLVEVIKRQADSPQIASNLGMKDDLWRSLLTRAV